MTINPNPFLPLGPAMEPRHPLANDVLAGAYPVTPESVRLLAVAEEKITAAAERLWAEPVETFGEWTDRIGADLAAGGTLPDDYADQGADAVQAAERRRVAHLALANLRSQMRGRWLKALQAHADEMLTGLAGNLDTLLGAVATAAETVDGLDLTDAEALAEATRKQLAAVTELKALRPRYRRVRHLQEQLLKATSESPPAAWGHPVWIGVFQSRVHEFRDVRHHGMPSEELPNVLWFRRLLDRDDLWLPTLTELGAAMTARTPVKAPRQTSPDPSAAFGALDPGTVAYLDAVTANNAPMT